MRAQLAARQAEGTLGYRLTVDLPAQRVRTPAGEVLAVPIGVFRTHCRIESRDDIAYALTHGVGIRAFEARRSAEAPWILNGLTEVNP